MVMQAIASDLLLWIWIILFALLPKVRGDTCRQVDMRGGGGRGEREKRDRERERERERIMINKHMYVHKLGVNL